MAQEELLDGIIYMAAHIIRGRHSLADSMKLQVEREEGVIDDNQEIMNLVNTRIEMYAEREFKGQDNILDDIINLTKKLSFTPTEGLGLEIIGDLILQSNFLQRIILM